MDRMDADAVKQLLGVAPERVTDLKGLMGDNSDNIPGVPRVGPKTAVRLLEQYGTLENVLANAADVRGQVGENLRTHEEQALLSKRLSVICTDAPVQFDAETMRVQTPDLEAVTELARRLELRALLERIQKRVEEAGPTNAPQQTGDSGSDPDADASADAPTGDRSLPVTIVRTDGQLQDAVESLKEAVTGTGSALVVDVAADGDDPMWAAIVGLLVGTAQQTFYFPVGHDLGHDLGNDLGNGHDVGHDLGREVGHDDDAMAADIPTWSEVSDALQPLLSDASIAKWCGDVKRLRTVLQRHGTDVLGATADISQSF